MQHHKYTKEHHCDCHNYNNNGCNLPQISLIDLDIICGYANQHHPKHLVTAVIGITDRNCHLDIMILRIIMCNVLPPETANNLLSNNHLMIIEIIGITIYTEVTINNYHTSIVNCCKHINLRLNRAGFHLFIHIHIITGCYLICQNFGLT